MLLRRLGRNVGFRTAMIEMILSGARWSRWLGVERGLLVTVRVLSPVAGLIELGDGTRRDSPVPVDVSGLG